LETDGDGTANVNATVHCNGFAGTSSAWFDLLQLEKFSEQLLAYPYRPMVSALCKVSDTLQLYVQAFGAEWDKV
jgi:hypothetical protein